MTPTHTGAGPTLHGRLDVLASYHYFRDDDDMRAFGDFARVRIIGDSGAFSAFTQGSQIRLPEYAAWIKRHRTLLYWAASLDVFGDPHGTYANWRTLRDDYGLDTVPTLHIGADPVHLDTYAAHGVDFVGLGGMVGMSKNSIIRWLVHVLRYARDHHPQMRFHAWGMSYSEYLDKLPLYSVDSSGLLARAAMFGSLALWDPRKRTVASFNLDGRTPYKHRALIADVYHTRPDQILKSHAGNRTLLMRISARSAQLRAEHLQARHRVSAPTWGINPTDRGQTGTRLHLVSKVGDYRSVLGLPPREAKKRKAS